MDYTENTPLLELRGIYKSFGETAVLNGIDLTVQSGEFVTLLGPSGCGKTTTLRIIAGLELPDRGTVTLEGRDVTPLPPNKRNLNTVFQNYALFPHMNVEQNIAYPLRLRRTAKWEIQRTVEELLELVQLRGYEKRMPTELSGGQAQRVAIARAVACGTKLLLLDEPLGALDLQLRRQMQMELKSLQKRLGIAFVYITHDQEEALGMSDRVAVMRDGLFDQLDTVSGIYEKPRTSYVARFVGSANILTAECQRVTDGVMYAACQDSTVAVVADDNVRHGDSVTIAVRSENVRFLPLAAQDKPDIGLTATVVGKSFAAGQIRVTAILPDGSEIVASRLGVDDGLKIGEYVVATWNPERAVLVDRPAPDGIRV